MRSQQEDQQYTSSRYRAFISLNQLVLLPQRPSTSDSKGWKEYWKIQGQPWRTEPEIDAKRQKELDQCRSIIPDIEKGNYPFKGIKLSRADVEWLLATHENGRGPVDWNDETQREREGLDLRGADLRQVNLQNLPLAGIRGALEWKDWIGASEKQRMTAMVLVEKAILRGAHLEGAILWWVNLEGADLESAHLQRADLEGANLKEAILTYTCLIDVNLEGAHLESASLEGAHLERASLAEAHLEGADLQGASLEGADLQGAHLEGTSFSGANLIGANLKEAYLNGANLKEALLVNENRIGPLLADIHWGDVNLTVMKWSRVKMLGDEYVARQSGKLQDINIRLDEYEVAVRTARQLAVILRTQGLNEHAGRFEYRALVLQQKILLMQLCRPRITIGQRIQRLRVYCFSLFLYLLAGYGYKLGRSFLAYVLVIVTFAAPYYAFGQLIRPPLSPLEAIIFSVISFHGRGFPPSENIGLSNPLTILAAIEAFVGLIIEVTLVATLTQRFFRK